MPAMITGSASGSSIIKQGCRRVMPTPRAGLADRGLDAGEAGEGVSQHRQHAVERKREHRRQQTERRKAQPEGAFAHRSGSEQQRIEQGEQGKAGDRLNDTGGGQQQLAQLRVIAREERERKAQRQPEHQREHADEDVAAEIEIGKPGERFSHPRINRHG